jgi:hypothetical protein
MVPDMPQDAQGYQHEEYGEHGSPAHFVKGIHLGLSSLPFKNFSAASNNSIPDISLVLASSTIEPCREAHRVHPPYRGVL